MLGVGLWGRVKCNSHMGKGHRAGASEYFGHMSNLSENFQFLEVKFSIYLNRCVF